MPKHSSGATHRWLLTPDSRGRLQLPVAFRGYPLFELQLEAGTTELRLQPLETRPASLATDALPAATQSALPPSAQPWLNADVDRFIETRLKPALTNFAKHPLCPHPAALVLFGSRVRGEALNSSDFDLAFFVPSKPNLITRRRLDEAIKAHLEQELRELARHGVSGELSVVFIPALSPSSNEDIPSLYASLATDGKTLVDEKAIFAKWRRHVKKIMGSRKYVRSGEGKASKWTWKKGITK